MANTGRKKYANVPNWLARRYPFVAALEDNPLYLALTGKRYCSRHWGGLWRRRKRWFEGRAQSISWMMLPFQVIVVVITFCFNWIAVAGPIALMRNHVADLRAEAGSGRLRDFYLSLSPLQIVDGLSGRRLQVVSRIYCVVIAIAVAGAAALATALLFVHDEEAMAKWTSVSSLFCVVCAIMPANFVAEILSSYRSIGTSIVTASGLSAADKSRIEAIRQIEDFGHSEGKYGCQGQICMMFLWVAGFLAIKGSLGQLSPEWLLPSIAMVAVLFNLMLLSNFCELVTDERNWAARLAKTYLALVIENNPPVDG